MEIKSNADPVVDKRVCQVKFPSERFMELTAKVIAEKNYVQCDAFVSDYMCQMHPLTVDNYDKAIDLNQKFVMKVKPVIKRDSPLNMTCVGSQRKS